MILIGLSYELEFFTINYLKTNIIKICLLINKIFIFVPNVSIHTLKNILVKDENLMKIVSLFHWIK